MVRSAGWLSSAVPAILEQHQSVRARTNIVRFAVVLRSDADVRALVLLRHACVVLDYLLFRVPHSHDVREVRDFLLQSDALASYRDFLEGEFVVEPVNDIGEGGDRKNLVDDGVNQNFSANGVVRTLLVVVV